MRFAPYRGLLMPLLLASGLAGCNAISDALSVDPTQLTTLTVTPSSLPADGSSQAIVTLRVPISSEPKERSVKFSVSSGALSDTTVFADVNGVATTLLQSGTTIGSVLVRASVGEIDRAVQLEYVRAYPDRIELDTSGSSMSASLFATITFEAKLKRSRGTPSEGTVVDFFVLDAAGGAIGRILLVTATDSLGRATATYTGADTRYRGPATVIARTNDASGRVIEARATIQIID